LPFFSSSSLRRIPNQSRINPTATPPKRFQDTFAMPPNWNRKSADQVIAEHNASRDQGTMPTLPSDKKKGTVSEVWELRDTRWLAMHGVTSCS
jgi:hypothetical protein